MARNKQKPLDFARGAQLSSLRSLTNRMEAEVGRVLRTANQTGVSLATAMLLLRQIDDHAGKLGACTASVYTLAKEIGRHKRTVQRALEVLDGQGLIVQIAKPVKTKVNSTMKVSRRVCWPNVLEEDVSGAEPIEGRVTRREDQSAQDGRQGDMVSRQGDMVSLRTYISSAQETPSPWNTEWTSLHLRLADLNAEYPGDALRRALQAGVSPGEVEARMSYWQSESRQQGWAINALVYSIAQSVPGLRADQGWPKRKSKGASPASPDAIAQAGERWKAKADRHSRYVQLELQFGATLDRVESEQPARLWAVLEQAGSHFVATAKALKQGLRATPIRLKLLQAAEGGQIT